MSGKQDSDVPLRKGKKSKKKRINKRWVISIVAWTCAISMLLSFLSSQVLSGAGYALAFLVLALFILLGIFFDIIGIASTTASEQPFHSMAAKKVSGAFESLRLIRNAEKVSSFCNDVVGDISGIISGATSAVIVSRLVYDFSVNTAVIQLIISAAVAGLTIGGKAIGKSLAINYGTRIVYLTGQAIYFIKNIKSVFRSKK